EYLITRHVEVERDDGAGRVLGPQTGFKQRGQRFTLPEILKCDFDRIPGVGDTDPGLLDEGDEGRQPEFLMVKNTVKLDEYQRQRTQDEDGENLLEQFLIGVG